MALVFNHSDALLAAAGMSKVALTQVVALSVGSSAMVHAVEAAWPGYGAPASARLVVLETDLGGGGFPANEITAVA